MAIAVTAANLRPALAAVGPVLSDLRQDLGLSTIGAAILTGLPVLCLGLFAPAAPRLARRLGLERVLALTLIVILVGLVLRVAGGASALFTGTVLAAAAIGVANVVVPTLIKRDFRRHTATMMGLYTVCLSGFAAVAAAATVPIGQVADSSWRAGLGSWALLALLGLVAWIPLLTSAPRASEGPETPSSVSALLRDRLAWQVTLFFGLQSLAFYSMLAWLPSIYRDAGSTAETAGLLLSIATLAGVPAGLLVPRLAGRWSDQRGLVLASVALIATGFLGVLFAPTTLAFLWVTLLGAGLGAGFALALLFMVLRAANSADTAQLSAMAQTFGYVLAAAGPFAVGGLRAATGSWTAALMVLVALTCAQLFVGLDAGRRGHVGGRNTRERAEP